MPKTKPVTQQPDVSYVNEGTIIMVEPVSQAAKDWFKEHVSTEEWQWMGDAFACEPRMFSDLLDGLINEGFLVEGSRG